MTSTKTLFTSLLLLLLMSFRCEQAQADRFFTPAPKKAELGKEFIQLGSNSSLVMSDKLKTKYKAVVSGFEIYLKGLQPQSREISIEISVLDPQDKRDVSTALSLNEAYVIYITPEKIEIFSRDDLGALYGLSFLEARLRNNSGKIQRGIIENWPDLKVRALHLVIINGVRPINMKESIKHARFGHYNTLIIQVKDFVRFKSMDHLVQDDSWSVTEFNDVVQFARENGLRVIPELTLLTHQERLLKNRYPHLMFNKSTYDPRKNEVYDIVLPIIDEIIEVIRPSAFHIGHDEVAGHSPKSGKRWLREKEKILPPELYLQDVIRLHDHLKKQGLETWMWGDMLISNKEFPKMTHVHIHGNEQYTKQREHLPKDIVICDWHYLDTQTEFPSALAFAKSGHRVLGATWKRELTINNFSKYIKNMPYNGEGMIATTWFGALKKDAVKLKRIIEISSEAFWNAK